MACASFGKEGPALDGNSPGAEAPVTRKSRPREYPSEWFAAHPGSKPTVCVPQCFTSEDDLVKAVAAALNTGCLQVEYAVQFMHVEGAKIKATLVEDWNSFGLTIGLAGEQISPWDLLAVSLEPGLSSTSDVAGSTAVEGDADQRKGLFAAVVCMYRILEAKHVRKADGLLRLQERLKKLFERAPFRCASSYFERAEEKYGDWLKNESYLSLIAALDMFFNRFPHHEMGIVRAGTLASRYKHCAVVQDIIHLFKKSGCDDDVMEWMFFPCLAEEKCAIFKTGEELFSRNSYSPYLIDLGLCRRSPYSAALNPLVHYWCHASAALIDPSGDNKSLNALITSDEDLGQVTDMAMVFAYACTRIELRPMYSIEGEAHRYVCEREAAIAARDVRETPITQSVENWKRHMSAVGFSVCPEINKFAKRQVRRFRNVREDTVGAKLIELILK